MTLQILGQTILGFRLSVAQILISLGTAALIEFAIGIFKDKAFAWPASGLLTGNSVAFILRVPGTVHGDWWSLRGVWIYVLAVAISMASKYIIRWRGQHIFNPSNLGLVIIFGTFGPRWTEPQDLWWIPLSWGMIATYAVIIIGGLTIALRLKVLAMEMAFLGSLALFLGVIVGPGHCMVARWYATPICDLQFWQVVMTSPEVLVFAFFMLSDPKTVPAGRVARILFGITVAFLSVLLLAPTGTEFWTKTALLGSLVVACALRVPAASLLPRAGSEADRVGKALTGFLRGWRIPIALGACVLLIGSLPVADSSARNADPVTALDEGALQQPAPRLAAIDPKVVPNPFNLLPASAVSRLNAPDRTGGGGAVAYIWRLPPLPPIDIQAKVTSYNPSMTPALAELEEHQLAQDLMIESEALRKMDPVMGATGAIGDGLKHFTDQIDAARGSGQIDVPTYTFKTAFVEMYLPKFAGQAPELQGISLQGSVHLITYNVGSGAVVSETDAPYTRVWGLSSVGLITTDYTGLTPA
ncbi:MAG TPA: hypothetical protein VG015_04195 [Candidatus Dormibacteraeota bacterium]|nr:hypothetical protein [Candidatus Dormibacteraeota bacterium]